MKQQLSVWVLMSGLLFSALMSTLGGCSMPLKSKLPVQQVYRLSPDLTPAPGRTDAGINLYLPAVSVNPALDNPHIMLAGAGNRLDFIADSRWPDKLSHYLQAVIIDGLATSGAFQTVSARMLGRENNYRLLLRVSDFQAELPDNPQPANEQQATIAVTIEAFLIRVQDQRLLGRYYYKKSKPAIPLRTGSIVAAIEQALGEVLTELSADLVKTTRKYKKAAL
jgi:ABC-type uncharacterized transport system auxiliary subunit